MTNHTPGPWTVEEPPRNFEFQIDGGGTQVAYGLCPDNQIDREVEAQANALLIAAAPDLLVALEACYQLLSTGRDHVADPNYDIITGAAVAIAKATGS